jgi:hypothetical protein
MIGSFRGDIAFGMWILLSRLTILKDRDVDALKRKHFDGNSE